MLFWNKSNRKNWQTDLKGRKEIVGIFILWLSVGVAVWGSQSVALGWNGNSGVAGYVVYSGNSSGNYSSRIDVGTNTVANISNLKEGQTNYFTVTAYNVAGMESLPAGEVAYIVPGLVKLTPGANPGDPASISFPVAASHWYEVQASSDLKSWITIQRTAAATANVWSSVLDPQSAAFPVRYYRLILH